VFYFRLALALGFPHPDHMLAVLTSKQITEWIEYHAIEPWGEPAAWYRSGILASLIANIHRAKNAPPFTPADFMPKNPERTKPKKQSPEEMKTALLQIAAANKGQKKRKR